MTTYFASYFRSLVLAVTMGIGVTEWDRTASAAELGLNQSRWEKPTITFWIGKGGGVSDSARADVESAIAEWNAALSGLSEIAPVPTLQPASNRRRADIVFDLAVHEKLNRFGGTVDLRGSTSREIDGCEATAATIFMLGTMLSESPNNGNALIRTFARHLIGRVIGLGVMDCGGVGPCTTDLMDRDYVNFLYESGIHDVDVEISECDLDGILAIYDPFIGCSEILESIPYACD